jgi:hypothetical protein
MTDLHSIEAVGIRATLDLRVGHVRDLAIERDGRVVQPLHTAPWVDDPLITDDETIPPNLRFLSGDFFCAPFGASDVEEAPPHGWTANSRWYHLETQTLPDGVTARYQLERSVMGATVEKLFTLRDGHPFLYETHAFVGGRGAVPVANHAMVRFPAGGHLSFSPKNRAETPAAPPEPEATRGRSRLVYPSRSADITRLPMADGHMADITHYPFAARHEDIVMLVEADGNRLGWAAAVKPDGDMFLSLKNPADFPVTVLWFSNGGRDYAPWNGRHIGVLGIEEGRTTLQGHRASIDANPLSNAGTPAALTLRPHGRAEVRNVVGGLSLAAGQQPVAEIQSGNGVLALLFRDGKRLELPFDTSFLRN